jgi:hypothetical protein
MKKSFTLYAFWGKKDLAFMKNFARRARPKPICIARNIKSQETKNFVLITNPFIVINIFFNAVAKHLKTRKK